MSRPSSNSYRRPSCSGRFSNSPNVSRVVVASISTIRAHPPKSAVKPLVRRFQNLGQVFPLRHARGQVGPVLLQQFRLKSRLLGAHKILQSAFSDGDASLKAGDLFFHLHAALFHLAELDGVQSFL